MVQAEIPSVQLVNIENKTIQNGYVTFGHVYNPGDVPRGFTLNAQVPGAGALPLQVDAKATHPDGSLRHAILTAKIASLAGSTTIPVEFNLEPIQNASPLSADALLQTAYDVAVELTVGGVLYSASARDLLQNALNTGSLKTWLSGPLVTEWLVMSPVKESGGQEHPHLTARFNIRAFAGMNKVRTAVIIENNWAFEPNPRGFTYDVTIKVGDIVVYSKMGLKHTHHSRWRKVVWWGEEAQIQVKYDQKYLFSTGAVPNYDLSVQVPGSVLSQMTTDFVPMSNMDINDYMPATGANADIGPLPRWASIYLLTMDARAQFNTLVNGDAGGSYQIHYRNKTTDLPVTIDDYPYMTLLGREGDTYNPDTGQYEAFPDVSNGLDKYTPDDAHQPSIAFLPYLISGDYYFLEELQFWANYNLIQMNPYYRDLQKGLLNRGQVRGQAWSLRTLGQAAFITPDSHPLKAYFDEKVRNNIDWYTSEYPQNNQSNKLGWLASGYALVYGPYGIAPWQDDFFTWCIGYLVDLGYTGAEQLLSWKAQFVVGRMVADGYCWLNASAYSLQVGTAGGVDYATFAQLNDANFSGNQCSGYEMDGYPDSPTGYGANMQPALAAAVDAGYENAMDAWLKYETRIPLQDYSESPQFDVVPRSLNGSNPTSVKSLGMNAPAKFKLYGNFPNPFNPSTTIRFEVTQQSKLTLTIFDITGRTVRTLLENKLKEPGQYSVVFIADFLPSGVYFYKLQSDTNAYQAGRMVLIK